MFLESIRQQPSVPLNKEQVQVLEETDDHILDQYYLYLEDQFRGSREDITERFKVYLPYLKEALPDETDRNVLDLGCGRGELLELLKGENFLARGVDLSAAMINECRSRKLDAVQGDVFEHLQSLPDECEGAVTAFHLIEHLAFRDQVKLMDETVRVLKVGGLAIFETPNPENLQVGSCNFYMDPTHRRPLPPMLFSFMAEQRGLQRVAILRLHPYGTEAMIPHDGTEMAARVNHFFYGPQDYAMIGYKV